MSKTYTIEFWGIDSAGHKFHEYIQSPSKKEKRVRELIEQRLGLETSDWRDFGMRRVFD